VWRAYPEPCMFHGIKSDYARTVANLCSGHLLVAIRRISHRNGALHKYLGAAIE
jgi:hypothetical protein